jgi:osmotically-inducible protein OsmY
MSRHTLPIWLITALLAGTTASAWAQFQGGGGGTGFGGTSGGGNAFGTSSFGGSLGSSGFGSGNFGTTGLGSGFGSSGIGTGGGTGGLGSSSFGGQGLGQSAYGTAQGGQAFVGRDSGDVQGMFDQIGRGSNQFFQQLNRTLGGNQNRNRQSGQQENAQLPVRVQLNVAFDQPRPQPSVLASTVRSRLERVLAGRSIAAPEVEVVGDVVILRGTAESESQRLVIEKLVSLEPGVWLVDNQLTVADRHPTAPIPPATDN